MGRKRGSKRRRRGRFSFLYKLLAVITVCAAIVTAMTLFFRVENIIVSGSIRYTEEEIRAACGVESGSNMYLMNKFEVQQRLREALPYIETVRINRRLPDTLTVTVTECTHVYAVTQDGVSWIFCANGENGRIVDRMEPAEARLLPRIEGCTLLAPSVGTNIVMAAEDEKDTRQASLLSLLAAADAAGEVGRISAYHLDNEAWITVDYAGRFAVRMPYDADYAYLLAYLGRVMEQLGSNETGIIDLTIRGEAHVITD